MSINVKLKMDIKELQKQNEKLRQIVALVKLTPAFKRDLISHNLLEEVKRVKKESNKEIRKTSGISLFGSKGKDHLSPL